MSGLGDALQMVGGSLMDMGKEKRLEKMRQEQESRDEDREKRREDRAYQRKLREVSGDPVPKRVNGKMVLEYKNSRGDVIRTEDVDPYTLEKFNIADRKDKLTLDQLTQNVELGGKKLRDYDSDRALDTQYRQAQISERLAARDENVAQAGAANRRGLEGQLSTDSASDSALAVELANSLPDLKKQYTEGDEPTLTAEEYHHLAQGSIIEAEKRGVDAVTLFRAALRGRAKQKELARSK